MDETCPVTNTSHTFIKDGEFNICSECGEQVDTVNFDAEWRYYKNNGSSNPARCHQTKSNEKTIDKLIENLKIPENIKKLTEQKYKEIVGQKTIRGKGRKAIVAACMFHVYKDLQEHRTVDQIRNMFDLSKQDFSGGMTRYYEIFKDDRTRHTEPEDLLKMVLNLTGISRTRYNEIYTLMKDVQTKSRALSNSSPMSTASSVVYFYLRTHPQYMDELGLTKRSFSNKVDLSDITVTKLTKEICKVMDAKGVEI